MIDLHEYSKGWPGEKLTTAEMEVLFLDTLILKIHLELQEDRTACVILQMWSTLVEFFD